MESIKNRASRLVKRLADVETQNQKSTPIGFNDGPGKEGKIVTLHFENGTSLGYTLAELYEANGIQNWQNGIYGMTLPNGARFE